MKGIARTVVQLIYGSGLQRWLARIGLGMTLLGFAALKTGWHPGAQSVFIMLAAAITVISPGLVGAIMFRALSASRGVQLIPHGRLKLILGAFSTQLLLALFIAVTVTTALSAVPDAHASLRGVGAVFAYAFSTLTFIFFNFYWLMQFRLAAFTWLLYILIPQLVSHAFPQLHPGALLVTPTAQVTVLTVSLLAWPVFAVIFLRQRHINMMLDWNLVGQGSSRARRTSASAKPAGAPKRYERNQAVRVLLIGVANIHRQMLLMVLMNSLALLTAMLITTHLNVASRTAFVWAFISCLFAGVVPATPTGLMTRRAKSLWLTARLGREELFMAVERQSWSMVLWVAGAAMALAVPLLSFSLHAMPTPAQLLGILVGPLTAGASGIYVILLLVRGKRLADTVLLTGYVLLLMIEMFSALAQSPTSILPKLLAANIIAIPLLRHIGLRRWQNIDWLIHKRLATQFPG
jgi:hypothetical protein